MCFLSTWPFLIATSASQVLLPPFHQKALYNSRLFFLFISFDSDQVPVHLEVTVVLAGQSIECALRLSSFPINVFVVLWQIYILTKNYAGKDQKVSFEQVLKCTMKHKKPVLSLREAVIYIFKKNSILSLNNNVYSVVQIISFLFSPAKR